MLLSRQIFSACILAATVCAQAEEPKPMMQDRLDKALDGIIAKYDIKPFDYWGHLSLLRAPAAELAEQLGPDAIETLEQAAEFQAEDHKGDPRNRTTPTICLLALVHLAEDPEAVAALRRLALVPRSRKGQYATNRMAIHAMRYLPPAEACRIANKYVQTLTDYNGEFIELLGFFGEEAEIAILKLQYTEPHYTKLRAMRDAAVREIEARLRLAPADRARWSEQQIDWENIKTTISVNIVGEIGFLKAAKQADANNVRFDLNFLRHQLQKQSKWDVGLGAAMLALHGDKTTVDDMRPFVGDADETGSGIRRRLAEIGTAEATRLLETAVASSDAGLDAYVAEEAASHLAETCGDAASLSILQQHARLRKPPSALRTALRKHAATLKARLDKP